MHQNIAVIVWQFNYGKNSFAVLVPERRRCCQLGSHFFYYFFPCPSVFTIFPHPPRRRRRQCTNKSCPMSSAFYSFSLYIYFSLSLSLSLCLNWPLLASFSLFSSFQSTIDSQTMFNVNFADDWIRTTDLWCWKRPLYQLSHNHFFSLFISNFLSSGFFETLF